MWQFHIVGHLIPRGCPGVRVRRRSALLIIPITLTALGSGCGGQSTKTSDSVLVYPESDTSSVAFVASESKQGEAWSVGAMPLCVDGGDGSVTVDKIETSAGSGLVVDQFETSSTSRHGGGRGPISEFNVSGSEGVVESGCEGGGYTNLIVQVSRTAETTGNSAVLSVSYQSSSGRGWLEIPFLIVLCAMGDERTDECRDHQ